MSQSTFPVALFLAFKILFHAFFSVLNLLLHTTSKLSADNLASVFVEKTEIGTSCFAPVPIYKLNSPSFRSQCPVCAVDPSDSSKPQGLCSLSYPRSLLSYQPRPLSGIISNIIQTCSGVVHSNTSLP